MPCEVIGTKPDSPTIIIRNTLTGEVRELHRNMLYPLHMVDRNDEGENATPVLVRANVVTDVYFACDCRNCRDAVQFRTGEGTLANLIIVIVNIKHENYLQRFCEASKVVRNCLVVNSSGTHD